MKKNVVVITGGSGGIGRSAADLLAKGGASVVIAGRNSDKLAAALAELPQSVVAFAGDLTDPKEVERLVAFTIEQFGQMDVLIHAAEDFHAKPLLEFEPADVERVLSTIGMIYAINLAALRQMNSQATGGVVVNISSRAGVLDDILADSAGYSASKLTMSGITRAANQEKTADKVRFIALCLGGVDTPMGRLAAEKRGLVFDSSLMLQPAEVAAVIADMVSKPKSFPHDVWRLDKGEGMHRVHSGFAAA